MATFCEAVLHDYRQRDKSFSTRFGQHMITQQDASQ